MVSRDEAIAIVEKLLDKSNAVYNGDLQIDLNNIGETTSHWVIGYNSAKYLLTEDLQYALLGNNPYAISKTSGEVDHDFDSSVPDFEL